MAVQGDVEALEALVPWDRPAFRSGLAALSSSVADAARLFAADLCTLAALAAQVPRCAGDEVGGTPWTSLRQEVAVARRISGQAAAAELRMAVRVTAVLPLTLHLLQTGRITVARARVFVTELEVLDDELARQLDTDLAERVAGLAPWRIKDEVRRAALALDPDAAAVRAAAATAQRDVTLEPLADGQACVTIIGPAVPLVRWYATLDARARALRAAGDPRNLAALRFDLATSTFPCLTHPPADSRVQPVVFGRVHNPRDTAPTPGRAAGPADADSHSDVDVNVDVDSAAAAAAAADCPAGDGCPAAAAWAGATGRLRLSGVEAASSDCRMSRPVQAMITVPVETALGLSNEPGWLDGYGWLAAPTVRLLLPDAQLRQVSIDGPTGQVLDLAARGVRPLPTPTGVRDALVTMATEPTVMSDTAWRTEPEHDPSQPLRDFTAVRDRTCDGPTQPRTRASNCDLDHDRAWPHGPTAAWNLVSRSRRAHQLKHAGWTPVRTATGTTWTSPTGQVVEVPAQRRPAPGTDRDPEGQSPVLPDPRQLHAVDTDQHTPVTDRPPLITPRPRNSDDPPPPF